MDLLFKTLFPKIFFIILIFGSDALSAQNMSKEGKRERMLADLDFIKNVFHDNYAPAEWKKAYSGWDSEVAIMETKQQILDNDFLSVKQFQKMLKSFFISAKDYHVSVLFHSTEKASLPFRIKGANGRYFFSFIDEAAHSSKTSFPFAVGDELLLIDHLPTDQVIGDLRAKEVGFNYEKTDMALAELFLTIRLGTLGHEIPQGKILLTGRKANSSSLVEHQLEWDYKSEKVCEPFNALEKQLRSNNFPLDRVRRRRPPFSKDSFFKKSFCFPQYHALAASNERQNEIGAKKSFLPSLGKVLWKASEESLFEAYLFALPSGKSGGYIRIPSYDFSDADMAAAEFADIIDIFQKRSDVLVIDQVNNPGGLVLLMYAMASMLTDQPLSVPMHRLMITQEDIFFAISEIPLLESIQTNQEALDLLGDSLIGFPMTYELIQSLKNHAQILIEEWNSGRQLTEPLFLYGIGPILPHPKVNYTKPILILVNSLAFSAGDFFPAIFQDNGRAKVIGTRTAGAGGYLVGASFRNLNGIADFHYTGSIAERSNRHLIENFGVTPDIPYETNERDLQNNYCEYVEKILQTLETQLAI